MSWEDENNEEFDDASAYDDSVPAHGIGGKDPSKGPRVREILLTRKAPIFSLAMTPI